MLNGLTVIVTRRGVRRRVQPHRRDGGVGLAGPVSPRSSVLSARPTSPARRPPMRGAAGTDGWLFGHSQGGATADCAALLPSQLPARRVKV